VTPSDGSDVAVLAAARAVAEAALALSRLQQGISSRIDSVNPPLRKAEYLFAHEHLRNARRRHARALGMGPDLTLRAVSAGHTEGQTRVDSRAADTRVGE
jgi:hypothetical protein